jgi:hypothetical protein
MDMMVASMDEPYKNKLARDPVVAGILFKPTDIGPTDIGPTDIGLTDIGATTPKR